ncbi:DNA cytosine methyltransferase, partial [Streptomyces niveus]|uniref:DNA cytosine methyltransferase n=1 Tax=Streptomyces niveus TaxID=193462 RepID=UPI0036EC92D1
MSSVVGWGYTQRPAPTVTGGGTATGGAEPFGNGTRQAMRKVIGTPLWADRDVPHLRPTVAECAALQGFRPDLAFHGRAGQQYLQVGNAVAVPVAAPPRPPAGRGGGPHPGGGAGAPPAPPPPPHPPPPPPP